MADGITPPTPPEPTADQLRVEIDVLKAQLSGMVPGTEANKLKVEIADLRAELAELKKPKTPPEPVHDEKGFFPKLF